MAGRRDIAAPALALAYGVGRIGCHVAGDGDWGSVTDVPWGVAYTNAIIGWVDPSTGIPYPPGTRVHPTPIYEFLQAVVVFVILWSLRKKNYAPGTFAWLYLILAGFSRFVVEFWRINPPLGWGLSEAQWFSLALIAWALFCLSLEAQKIRLRKAAERAPASRLNLSTIPNLGFPRERSSRGFGTLNRLFRGLLRRALIMAIFLRLLGESQRMEDGFLTLEIGY